MAIRYCGTLRLNIRLQADDSYTVRITELNDDARFETLTGLNLSPFMRARTASDSAQAYDEAARAAIDFAGYADEAIFNFAECADDGNAQIRRQVATYEADEGTP